METDQIGRLRDIREACLLIESYVADVTSHDFFGDTEKQDAVIRRIEIIGEATAHLSDTTRIQLPLLPFRQMRGMRNTCATSSRTTMETWMSPSSGRRPPRRSR